MFGVYVRVSSVGQNTAGQKHEIQHWLDGNGVPPSQVRWFEDTSSGDDLERPAFVELQKAVFNGEVGTIVVWKLDRLSRNIKDGINTLADWCDQGLRVVSVTQQIDFNGAVGKLLAAVLLGIAEMENETRRERQKVGIAAAKERGVYRGRKPGTTRGRPARAGELRERGLSVEEIANAMGVAGRTVRRYLAMHTASH